MSTRQTRVPGAAAAAQTSETQASTEAKPAPSARAADAPAELPNAIDIDAKTIRGPVMTKQGWVCPDESGRVPRDAFKP